MADASAAEKSPSDYRIRTLQGIALSMKAIEPRFALAAFHRALTVSPLYPAALKGGSQVLSSNWRQTSNSTTRTRSLRWIPGDQTAQSAHGVMQDENRNCQSAFRHFEFSKDAIHSHTVSSQRCGSFITRLKHLIRQFPSSNSWLRLPRTIPMHGTISRGTNAGGPNQAAVQTLAPLIAAHTSDPDVLGLASEADEAVGDTPSAVSLLRQAIVIEPTNADFYARFASLCLDHDSDQVGIDMLNAGLQRIPNDPSLYVSRGLLYSELAQYDKAEADFDCGAAQPGEGS